MLTALIISNVAWAWFVLGLLNLWLDNKYDCGGHYLFGDYFLMIAVSPIIFIIILGLLWSKDVKE